MKTYYLILSKNFEAPFLAGQEMLLRESNYCFFPKYHTVRENYDLWSRRFAKILSGEACLSVRVWEGRPYGKGSKQRELERLTRDDGIGIQKLEYRSVLFILSKARVDNRPVDITRVAHNDGLSLKDFLAYIETCNLSKPFALIHFTPFRY